MDCSVELQPIPSRQFMLSTPRSLASAYLPSKLKLRPTKDFLKSFPYLPNNFKARRLNFLCKHVSASHFLLLGWGVSFHCFDLSASETGFLEWITIARHTCLAFHIILLVVCKGTNLETAQEILVALNPIHHSETSNTVPTCSYIWPDGQGDQAKFFKGRESSEAWGIQHGSIYRIWSGMSAEV